MSTNDKKSVSVPVRTVNLGATGKPNESTFTEEDKEILGGFNVPLGKGEHVVQERNPSSVSMGDRRQQSRELALARAREVKKQKYSKPETQEKQQSEPAPVTSSSDFREFDDVPLVETEPPPLPQTNYTHNPNTDRNDNDTPSLISPARKRKILQMLQDLSDDEDEAEAPPKKKPRTSTTPVKESFLRNFVADKTVDFGRFLAASAVLALLSGTLKTFTSGDVNPPAAGVRSSDWFRE